MRSGNRARMKVGLLGGSFNPPHDGHRYISINALKYLGLHQVWWLVTPGNPLKNPKDLMPLPTRVQLCRALVRRHSRINVMDIEKDWGSPYTYNTLKSLKKAFPNIQFIWLMGADNLSSFNRWKRWQTIFHHVPLAIFDRDHAIYQSIKGKAATMFRRQRFSNWRCFNKLGKIATPAWVYLPLRRHPASSTSLRKHWKNR